MALDVYKDWLGIPEGPRPPDFYSLLRLVEFEDSPEKIRANYKKLNAHVRKYATGQYSIQSQELLNELAKAMLCLTDVERKKEYDQGLGREFEEEKGFAGRKSMETLLVERGHVSAAQMKEAREHAERSGLSMRDAVVQLKLVDAATAAQALADEIGIPFFDLADIIPEDEVLDMLPRQVAKQHSILPLYIDHEHDKLILASIDLIGPDLEDELRLRFGMPIRPVLAAPMAINQAITKYYAPGLRKEPAELVPAKGVKKKKEATAATPKEKKVKLSSEEQKKQNKQIAIVIFCQSFVVTYLIDWFIVTPDVFFDKWTFIMYFTVVPIASFVAWQFYRKSL